MAIFSAGSASVQIVPDFSGAQKAIGAWFASQGDLKVSVKPDLNNADLARVKAEIGSIDGTAKVNVDKSSISQDVQSGITDGINKALGVVGKNTGLAALSDLVNASLKPALISTIAGAFTELAAAASQAVGILALAPAGLLAIAAPAAVVALGVSGMSAAFKALSSGNLQQIQQAMAKLSPAAQQLVLDIHALGPAFDAMKMDVQQQLWNGVGSAVTNLAHVALPVLQAGLHGVAADMNSGILATIHTLQADAGQFPAIFSNIVTAGKSMAGTMAPLTDAFVRMANVGSSFLPQIAAGFLKAALAADQWVQHAQATGQLQAIIQAAINVITELGKILLNVGSIITAVFQAALPYGNVLLGLLVQLTGSLATFLHSTQGQTALTSFFASVQQVVSALIGPLNLVIQALVRDFLPAIGALAAALAPVVGQLLTEFATVLDNVAGVVPPLAKTIADLVNAFAPLIPVLGTLITTILPPLLTVLDNLAPVIGQFTAGLGVALLAAVRAITPFLIPLGAAFTSVFQALLPLLPPLGQLAGALGQALAVTLTAILNAIQPLIPPFVQFVQQLIPPLVGLLVALGPLLGQVVADFAPLLVNILKLVDATVLPFLVGLINNFTAGLKVLVPLLGPLTPVIEAIAIAYGVWTAAQWLLNIAMTANPIGIVIVAIGLLIVAIGFIATHTQEVGQVWNTVWGGIQSAAQTVWTFLSNLAQTIFGGIAAAWNTTWTAVRDFFVNLWNGIVSFFQGLWNGLVGWFVAQLASVAASWQATWTGVSSFFTGVWNGIVSFFEGLWNALASWFVAQLATYVAGWQNTWTVVSTFFQGVWNTLVSWVEGIWTGLAGWFAAAWAALTSAWQNTWNAIFAFFQNLWNTLVGWVEGVWTALAGWFAQAWAAYTAAWTNTWNAILAFFQNLWNTLVGWVEGVWTGLAGWFAAAWSALASAWNATWTAILTFLQTTWNTITTVVQGAWNTLSGWLVGAVNTFAGVFEGVWNTISGAVAGIWNGLVAAIQSAWNTLTGIVEAPIKFVVNTVINGFIGGVDDVMGFLKLPWSIPKINLPFADGGFTGPGIFGTGGKYDPAGIVHAGEYVINQEQTALHLPLLQAINTGTGGFAAGGLVPGYAGGGLVGEIAQLVIDPVGTLESFFKSLLPPDTGGLTDILWNGAQQMVDNSASTIGSHILDGIKSAWSTVSGLLGTAANAIGSALGILPPAGAPGGGPVAAIPSSQSANVAAVLAAAAGYGWNSGAEWNALVNVIMRESGFNNNAQNPTSTAYGMFQFLDTTWAGFPYPKTSNPAEQAVDGMLYIKSRYGDPLGALAHEQAFGWYDQGGILPPGYSTIFNGTGSNEIVLNPAQQSSLNQALTPSSSSKSDSQAQPVWQFFLGDREITDLVDARVTYWSASDARNIRSSV